MTAPLHQWLALGFIRRVAAGVPLLYRFRQLSGKRSSCLEGEPEFNRFTAALALILALAGDAAAQSTITYGVFINHGETTTWTAPWDRTHNTDEGHKTGVTVGFDVTLLDWADFATFVATDGAIGLGPRLRPGTYRRFSPFVDAMIVNLHYNPFAMRTWSPETGFGTDFALTQRVGVRYHWTRSYLDGDHNRSFTTVSVSLCLF